MRSTLSKTHTQTPTQILRNQMARMLRRADAHPATVRHHRADADPGGQGPETATVRHHAPGGSHSLCCGGCQIAAESTRHLLAVRLQLLLRLSFRRCCRSLMLAFPQAAQQAADP